jgi:hypothetical protein
LFTIVRDLLEKRNITVTRSTQVEGLNHDGGRFCGDQVRELVKPRVILNGPWTEHGETIPHPHPARYIDVSPQLAIAGLSASLRTSDRAKDADLNIVIQYGLSL